MTFPLVVLFLLLYLSLGTALAIAMVVVEAADGMATLVVVFWPVFVIITLFVLLHIFIINTADLIRRSRT